MPCRPPTLDVQTVAELYSQLSGVLAGFALAAVFIVISHFLGEAAPTGRREEALGQALPALLAALLGLVLSSLTYCVVAADGDNPGRALFQHVVAGVGFSVAGALLIFATSCSSRACCPTTPFTTRGACSGSACPCRFSRSCATARTPTARRTTGGGPGWLGALIVLLLSSVLAVSVLGYAAYGRPGLDRIRVTGGGATWAIAVSGLTIVTVCLLSVVTTMGLAGTGCSVPIGAVVTVLLCGFLAAVGLCVWLFVTRPARPTAPVPAPTRAPVVC